jgi:hypothetical protein
MKVYVLKGSDIRTVGTIVDISTTPKPGYEEMTLEELASVRGKFVWMLYHNCIDKKYNWVCPFVTYDEGYDAMSRFANDYAGQGYTVVDCGDIIQIQKNKTVVTMTLVPMQLGQPYGGRIYPYKK